MPSIRDHMQQKPWIGWAVAGVLFAAAIYLYMSRSSASNVEYGQEYMTQMVTVKFADTGDEMELPRGRFEKMLRDSAGGTLDAAKGLINPKTNQPTGFLFSKSDWDQTISRINQQRKELGTADNAGGGGIAPAPSVIKDASGKAIQEPGVDATPTKPTPPK